MPINKPFIIDICRHKNLKYFYLIKDVTGNIQINGKRRFEVSYREIHGDAVGYETSSRLVKLSCGPPHNKNGAAVCFKQSGEYRNRTRNFLKTNLEKNYHFSSL